MPRLLVVARESKPLADLRGALERGGFTCMTASPGDEANASLNAEPPDAALVEVSGRSPETSSWEFARRTKAESRIPVIILIAGDIPDDSGRLFGVDDFLTSPYDAAELAVRVRKLLGHAHGDAEVIKCDGIVIDVTNCEVVVRGKVVELTFKEYELLKLLAANRGRVFTRTDLLNKIWGYEYFGGDRTVDVHIRRLRSKIEGPGEVFIETVRNIGYRIKKERG
jgi:DNA-binding response OmpR family regulator